MVEIKVADPFVRCHDIAMTAGVSRNTVTRRLKKYAGETYRGIHATMMLELIASRQAGESVASFCRRVGMPRSTYYYWRQKSAQYSGL